MKSEKYRKHEDRAPGYDRILARLRENSPIINRGAMLKNPVDPSRMSEAHTLGTKQGMEGYLQSLIVERSDPSVDLADAGAIEKAAFYLEQAEKHLTKINQDRKMKGKEPITASEMPATDRQAQNLAHAQASYDLLLMERDRLREWLKKIEQQQEAQVQEKKQELAYVGKIGGYKHDDLECPRAIDGRSVVRGKDGTIVFEDDGSPVSEYLQECKRRKDERTARAQEARKVIKQRDDIERNKVPRGVLEGKKSIHDWLAEKGEQAATA